MVENCTFGNTIPISVIAPIFLSPQRNAVFPIYRDKYIMIKTENPRPKGEELEDGNLQQSL